MRIWSFRAPHEAHVGGMFWVACAALQYEDIYTNKDNRLLQNDATGSRIASENACSFARVGLLLQVLHVFSLPVQQPLPALYRVMKSCPNTWSSYPPAGSRACDSILSTISWESRIKNPQNIGRNVGKCSVAPEFLLRQRTHFSRNELDWVLIIIPETIF